jgi:hypothetical protein
VVIDVSDASGDCVPKRGSTLASISISVPSVVIVVQLSLGGGAHPGKRPESG